MEEPDLVLVYLKRRFGEVSAQVSETPLLSGKHHLFPPIIHWEMSCPLKESGKLILITRGKAAVPSCQPRQCPVPCLCSWISVVRSNWQCLREETKNKWQMLLCSSGRISRIQHREDAISRELLWLWCPQNSPHPAITGSWLRWDSLWSHWFLLISQCKLKLHHIKQRKCYFNKGEKNHHLISQGPFLVGHSPATEITTGIYFLLTDIFTK